MPHVVKTPAPSCENVNPTAAGSGVSLQSVKSQFVVGGFAAASLLTKLLPQQYAVPSLFNPQV